MGLYLGDYLFAETAPPRWEALLENVRRRFGETCRLETPPEPERREWATIVAPHDGARLRLHDGMISISHGPQISVLTRAIHRSLVDFGGAEARSPAPVVLAASDPPPTLAAIAKRLEHRGWGRVRREEHATFDPPLQTSRGPLLAEGFFTLGRAKVSASGEPLRCEVRIHHRVVTVGETPAVVEALVDLGCQR